MAVVCEGPGTTAGVCEGPVWHSTLLMGAQHIHGSRALRKVLTEQQGQFQNDCSVENAWQKQHTNSLLTKSKESHFSFA